MKQLLSLVCLLCVSLATASPSLPSSVLLSEDGSKLLVGTRNDGIRICDAKTLQKVGEHPATSPVTGLTLGKNGTIYYTLDNGNEGKLCRSDNGASVVTGNTPMSPVFSPCGKYVYLCNRFDATVQKYDAETLQLLATAKAVREPHGLALGKFGTLLFAINLLPDDVTEPVKYTAAKVTIIDTASFTVVDNIHLPDGSTGVRGITASPDGKHIYLTHTQARYQLPTTQLERGWMNTAALSIIDGETGKYINTVLLDDVDLGAANPWGVAVTPDGTKIVVAHAGTREVSVIDRAALHKRLDRAAAGEKVTEVTFSAAEVHNDLSFLSGIRSRHAFKADGPRGIVTTNDTIYTACLFADKIAVVPFTDRVVRAKLYALNDEPFNLKQDTVLYGEMLFNDGDKCFQKWQSCASCHPDGRVDGLNWDLMNDGIGTPKQTKSLYLSNVTPPTMITGIRKDMKHCNRAGFRQIQFTSVKESDAEAIDAYVIAMQPQVSPYNRPENAAAIARGKALFVQADCARCHRPDVYFTACEDPNDGSKAPLFDVGLGTRTETGRKFDVPTLNEVWRTAPYLYDGRAKNMREVLTTYNIDDQHGITSDLSEEELADLELYILSL